MDFSPPVFHVGDVSPRDAHMLTKHVRRVDMLRKPVAYVLTLSVSLFDWVHANGLNNKSAVLRRPVLRLEHRTILRVEAKTDVEVAVLFWTGT